MGKWAAILEESSVLPVMRTSEGAPCAVATVTRIGVSSWAVDALLPNMQTDFKRRYQKLGDFWLPESNERETKARFSAQRF